MKDLSLFTNPPVIRHREVFHVGTFNPSDKSDQGDSFEGDGLSVSLHPQEWISIARLGGRPTWKLSCSDDLGNFLDAHALSTLQISELCLWGQKEGFVSSEVRWKASWVDCEDSSENGSSRVWSLHSTKEAALIEVEDLDGHQVECVEFFCGTSKMSGRCGFNPDDMNSLDILKTFFAEEHGLDGVWWQDTLDPFSLSAPRGVINKSRLASWDHVCVQDARPAIRKRSP